MTNKPILVTGSHRSGSTWVGNMIASSDDVIYIREPFNVKRYRPGILHQPFNYWFTYIDDHNQDLYYKKLRKTIALNYNLVGALKFVNFSKPASKKVVKEFLKYQEARYQKKRALMKDPIAILSTEWLAKIFNMQVIILVRHPAAFASSLKINNWNFDFNNLLNQPTLMDQHLENFWPEIEDYAKNPPDIIDQACLLWRIIYFMVSKYKHQHPDWKFIRHEDISREPLHEFRSVFDYLGLNFTEDVQKVIYEHSYGKYSEESPIKRNSLANIYKWKDRLLPEEVTQIRNKVSDISTIYYTDDDWNPKFL